MGNRASALLGRARLGGRCAKAREQLDWAAEDDLPTGFALLADWLREHPSHWGRYGIDLGERV